MLEGFAMEVETRQCFRGRIIGVIRFHAEVSSPIVGIVVSLKSVADGQ